MANPITEPAYGNEERGKRAMILLKDKVLKDILLRRTKLGRAADLALPPRIVCLLSCLSLLPLLPNVVAYKFFFYFHVDHSEAGYPRCKRV